MSWIRTGYVTVGQRSERTSGGDVLARAGDVVFKFGEPRFEIVVRHGRDPTVAAGDPPTAHEEADLRAHRLVGARFTGPGRTRLGAARRAWEVVTAVEARGLSEATDLREAYQVMWRG